MLSLEPFLTAYDPSDLPGGSIDPLGFERGYLFLAERILPGLTNAANRPRYFSVLCAAISISDAQHTDSAAETPRMRHDRRQLAVSAIERFWALACVLASERDDGLEPSGIRGVRDAQHEARRLGERGADVTKGNFRLLARQTQYGLLGIYANVAARLGLIELDTLSIGGSLGQGLATAFIGETKLPKELAQAVAWGGEVKLSTLAAWGKRAHIIGNYGAVEGRHLREALHGDSRRSRMATLLAEHPLLQGDDQIESELARLARTEAAIANDPEQLDLREALRAIREYEQCYRLCALVFLRLLWMANAQAPLSVHSLASDRVLLASHAALREHAAELAVAFEGSILAQYKDAERLAEPLRAVMALAQRWTPVEFALGILERHRQVQQAKRDGGRPKMPWIERDGDNLRPTLAVAQQVDRALETPDEVAPHFYRTFAVDNFGEAKVAP